MIPISVCIIAKNEEERIEKCLAPLMTYDFEIIVVDTGSTDRTKELALKYTKNVYDFEWINDFSAARNFSLKKASHNYVLVLDCDEYLTDIDLEGVYKAVEQHPQGVGRLLRNNYYDTNGKRTNFPDRVERLFHKRHYYYKSSIHEQVTNIKTDSTYYDRYDIPLTVDHAGYLGGIEAMIKKAERNNELLFKEIEQHPDDAYLYFQVGQSYNAISDYENSYIYYKKAFELPINPEQPWLPVMVSNFISSMTHTGRAQEALEFITPRYDSFANNSTFFCSMGVIYLNVEQPLKAMMEFVKAIQCPNCSNEGTNTYIPYYNMGLCNELLGNMEGAITFYRKSAAYEYPLAMIRLQELGTDPA